jgi:hypothetical protein
VEDLTIDSRKRKLDQNRLKIVEAIYDLQRIGARATKNLVQQNTGLSDSTVKRHLVWLCQVGTVQTFNNKPKFYRLSGKTYDAIEDKCFDAEGEV